MSGNLRIQHRRALDSDCNGLPYNNRPITFRNQYQTNVDDARSGVVPEAFRRGADPSDEGAKIRFSGHYKCQKSPKKNSFSPSYGRLA